MTSKVMILVDTGYAFNSANFQFFGSVIVDPVKAKIEEEKLLQKLSFRNDKPQIKMLKCSDTILDMKCEENNEYI
eukprot:CAMPEP_0116896510 /NCGR_PEP_ID=MMETSP0467-20121206/5737_1 /TAXON_ID=283647 /ORGANISM="Mesodinium pulex, Strain SPMC105" /LENGTH=74 /DNA_ID=CAMNT_0004567719 /DNA_START=1893 /DNA_END=2117 /DNA_ORIENTATION=-